SHPRIHGWGAIGLLSRLSYRIATAIDPSQRYPVVSCTFWHVDRVKQRLYVRGTTRFDYEYIASRTLPLQGSLMGAIANGQHLPVFRQLFRNSFLFARPGKA